MAKRFHLCMNIRGCLLNNTDEQLNGILINDAGREMNAYEVKSELLDLLAKGHEVIPVGNDCDNFDIKTGCRGHDIPKDEED